MATSVYMELARLPAGTMQDQPCPRSVTRVNEMRTQGDHDDVV